MLLYLLPVITISAYNMEMISTYERWIVFAIGLFFGAIGSCILFLCIRRWESSWQQRVELLAGQMGSSINLPPPLSPSETIPPPQLSPIIPLSSSSIEIDELKENQIRQLQLDQEALRQRYDQTFLEFDEIAESLREQLKKKEGLINNFKETSLNQKEIINRMQDQIGFLEAKERDLNYEIKTLLQLSELEKPIPIPIAIDDVQRRREPELPVRTPERASLVLARCIELAQKFSGASCLTAPSSRFRDLVIDYDSLDLRRLFEQLSGEESCLVLFYSTKDNQPLFINSPVKELLGWAPEKFIACFPEITQECSNEWKTALTQLNREGISRSCLPLKTKSGPGRLFYCQLGVITTGLFRNHAIGVLYPAI